MSGKETESVMRPGVSLWDQHVFCEYTSLGHITVGGGIMEE